MDGKFTQANDIRDTLRSRYEGLAERLYVHINKYDSYVDENGIFVALKPDSYASDLVLARCFKFTLLEALSLSIVSLDNGGLAIRLH